MKKKTFSVLMLFIITAAITTLAIADEGQMFRRNVSRLPDGFSYYASMGMMHVYVPAQRADGTLEPIEYYDANDILVETREFAKPLIAGYVDEPYQVGPGEFLPHFTDAYGEEASSDPVIQGGVEFGMARDAFAAVSFDDGTTWKQVNLSQSADLSSFTLKRGYAYPGDVHNMPYIAVEGRTTDDGTQEYYALAAWVSKYCSGGLPAYSLKDENDALIYEDLFGVAGAQRSVDFTLLGFPTVGEIPFGCVWTARGTLEDAVGEDGTPDGTKEIVWRKAERLTSGRRDANLPQIAGTPGGGFVIVWQEDPEGLRPGQGLGPGEGWSGAVVNQKTDMWYSYIGWDDFALTDEEIIDTTPKVGVPFSMPVRISDNNACRPENLQNPDNNQPYCLADFNSNGVADLCATTVSWTNPSNVTLEICQTEDGRVLSGRTGASRTRLSLQPYTKTDGTTSAWVIMAYEENKGLGNVLDPDTGEPVDIGKNIWYHSFDMFTPDLVSQGSMLNAPAKDPATGLFYDLLTDEWENDLYITDIARRFALMAQPISKFYGTEALSGTSAIGIFKQGADNQGGPADIMLRRFVIPKGFNPEVDNPYAYENMECGEWKYTDGGNPNYVNGLCLAPPINVSGTSIVACVDNECPVPAPEPGSDVTWPRIIEWEQTPENLADEWWANPYDVSKGHRGFIDGDFVMMMYAWSPNWNQNTVGNDHYNLYIRRSFDGGLTWTTTPANYTHWDGTNWSGDGTTTCENWGYGQNQYPVCTDYGSGEFEQARNVSQLLGNKITVLDPRFTPSGGPKAAGDILTDGKNLYDNDLRDPSKFFVIYETGDNTTVVEGEAVPLNLYYSRATNWGDDYYEVEYYDKEADDVVMGWDWLENSKDDLSGEACVWSDPGGRFFYAVWNQWREPDDHTYTDSDIWFRRVMWPQEDEGNVEPLFSVKILFYSHTHITDLSETVKFVGSTGLRKAAGYRWSSSLNGEMSSEKIFSIPASELELGTHVITFEALNDEGDWVSAPSIKIEVGHSLYLPAIGR